MYDALLSDTADAYANGICLGKVRAFKVTQFSDSSKDDERKKAQKATKPAFGLGNVGCCSYFQLKSI